MLFAKQRQLDSRCYAIGLMSACLSSILYRDTYFPFPLIEMKGNGEGVGNKERIEGYVI